MTDELDQAGALPEHDARTLLAATGRADVVDALHWIGEERPLRAGTPLAQLLTAVVSAADFKLAGSELALRITVRSVLRSSLDTSAELVLTENVIPPYRYEAALGKVAARTPTGTLADITHAAVWAAQAEDPLVIEALGLVAGLSWRDLQDRSAARGTVLPSQPSSDWNRSQVMSAFGIVDDIVCGRVESQLSGAVAARPVELLVGSTLGWAAVEAMRVDGVSYGTLLAQRDVGSAWSAHRNRTNTELSRSMVRRVLSALNESRVGYWSTEGNEPVSKNYLANKAGVSGRPPGQLSVVTRRSDGSAGYAVLIAVARDGGTARKTAATLLQVPTKVSVPCVLVLFGTGWADRTESDDLIRAYGGRLYTENTLTHLAAMAAAV